jgi:alkylation response protein AidB-like acyl-CoA dehydrogenase
MATPYMNMNSLRFMLFEVQDLNELLQYERFSAYDAESGAMLLQAVKDFADKEAFPYFREMDEKPASFKDGQVLVHPQVKTMMEKGGEMGLIGSTFDYEKGGMQLPVMLAQAAYFILDAANNNLTGYPGLTSGSAGLLLSYGSQALKDTYVGPMLQGKWAGTMCLTEPQAGSSLSDITTTAYPTAEGYYHLKGQKIWISGGDQQYSENIVHLVLARIEGAPAGTKGISLFVVPKKRPEGGELKPNDVHCAGDFQKLGQRGYATTHLVFGDGGDCRGWLVGEAHQGLPYMFQMMNGARISVGRGGVAVATAAYYASLQYAKERPQGRRLSSDGSKDLSQGQTLIINHPDVRRMLLFQKAIAEGTLSLVLQAASYQDREKVAQSEEERQNYNLLLEMLTPIVKTYPSEMAQLSISQGLQVLGGMGFSSETPLQQYYRDARILAIYEGTTGIQALDLLGRKVSMEGGKALSLLMAEIRNDLETATAFDALKPYVEQLEASLQRNREVLQFLTPFARQGNYERYLADATLYMEYMGIVVMGWQWLKIATKAQNLLVAGSTAWEPDFLEAKVHTMKFFFKYELPKTHALVSSLTSADELTIAADKEVLT